VNGNRISPRQAGPEVLALLEDEEFLRFMSMEGLTDKSKSGEFFLDLIYAVGNMILIQVFTCRWWDLCHAHGPRP
jgi:hypothetical protein